uniref:Uncharacterized protein n=1 Tax=Panagrolaimus sp. PS1159 TaxID=55785 RepID=A0AC35GDK3_9BILA
MASNGVLPYEKEELKRICEENYGNIRNIITKRFYPNEHIVSRWINFLLPSDSGDSNATIAHPKRSDKSSFDRINEAGETLSKNRKTNIDENNFEGDISSAPNVLAYMNKMFEKLRKLDKSGLILSENDIKLIVANIMEQTITNIGSNINESITKEWKSPIIDTKKGSTIAWIKYTFTLINSIREAFYSTDFIKIKVTTNYFSFENENELQAALK